MKEKWKLFVLLAVISAMLCTMNACGHGSRNTYDDSEYFDEEDSDRWYEDDVPSGEDDDAVENVDIENPIEEEPLSATFDYQHVISELDIQVYMRKHGDIKYLVRNNSDYNLNISIGTIFYENAVDREISYSYRTGVPKGSETVLSGRADDEFVKCEYIVDISECSEEECYVDDISYVINTSETKDEITFTNNGNRDAEDIYGQTMYFKDDELIFSNLCRCINQDDAFAAGSEIEHYVTHDTPEMPSIKGYDSYKVVIYQEKRWSRSEETPWVPEPVLLWQAENDQETSVSNDWQNELVEGYWENFIQSYKVYKFLEDGTVYEYDIEPWLEITPENLILSREYQYVIDGDILRLYDKNWQIDLKWVNKDDQYDWDIGIVDNLPENEGFFYETGWIEDELSNALYLVKSKNNA